MQNYNKKYDLGYIYFNKFVLIEENSDDIKA